MIDALSQFRVAMAARGLVVPPDGFKADGHIHRCDVNGPNGRGDGSYLVHADDLPAGGFQNWQDGLGWTDWRAEGGCRMTTAEDRERARAMRAQRDAEQAQRHKAAADLATLIWHESSDPTGHAYLSRKAIGSHGTKAIDAERLKELGGHVALSGPLLIIPMRGADGEMRGLQFVSAEGEKRFLPGTAKAGAYFSIGGKPSDVLAIAEGFATGAAVHEATAWPMAVAFDAGNLKPVAKALREKFPKLRIVIAGDHDESGTGQKAAHDAAQAAGAVVALPPNASEDWNDAAAVRGLETVRAEIEAAITPLSAGTDDGTPVGSLCPEWQEPQPLTVKLEPEPYPLDALPGVIRAAVEEVAGFVKAPIPLVASSALAALSLACQARFDVQRAERLQGPTSLFLLTIAESGERKSTCDGYFLEPIRQHLERQAEVSKPALERNKADYAAWAAERDGVLAAIKDAGRKKKSADDLRAALADLQHREPKPPRVPRMLLGDETPENLAWSLARIWPSAGIISSEAGVIFGAHGMGRDSVMRNLGLLNVLWDGGTHSVGRRTSESFTVQGARLTVGLQVQEATLRSFFDRTGQLARGSGFLARFLVAWPESTQGHRAFSDPPESWPHLTAFHRRIEELLQRPLPMDDGGALSPLVLPLAPDAKAVWVEFHDAIEAELRSGGELYDVRDVASKAADNAARLAALFEVFEHGTTSAVGPDSVERAGNIAAWHLSEARRFFGELALPAELADAVRLDNWLIEYGRRTRTVAVRKNHVRQHGPIRDGARLDAAIKELSDFERLRLATDGRRQIIQLNPVLGMVSP